MKKTFKSSSCAKMIGGKHVVLLYPFFLVRYWGEGSRVREGKYEDRRRLLPTKNNI